MNRQGKSVISILVVSLAAGCALAWTMSKPDRHPFVFALGLSWIIACGGGALSQVFWRSHPTWFRVAPWECNGRFYDWVGISAFRWVLLHTPIGWLGPITLRSGRSDLDRLLRNLAAAEAQHAISAALSLLVAGAYALRGDTAIAIWLVLITIPLNVYPVMVQRRNRGRVLRLQQHMVALGNDGRDRIEETTHLNPE